MAEKIPDPSELVMAQKEALQYLTGEIDAVSFLVSALVAKLSPDLAVPLLDQIVELKAKSKRETLSAYEKGFASLEAVLLRALKTVGDAEKIRDLSGPAKH